MHDEIIRGWDYPDMMQAARGSPRWMSGRRRAGSCSGPVMLQAENEPYDDVPPLYANIRSYNRWLDDEWGSQSRWSNPRPPP